MAARSSVRQSASERQHPPATTRPGDLRSRASARPGDAPERPLGAATWEHTNNVGQLGVDEARQERRSRRWRLQDDLRRWWPVRITVDDESMPDRRVGCGIWRCPTHGAVGVHLDPATGVACFSGLQVCGSVWTCPVCSVAIRERRADEIRVAGAVHLAAAGGLAHLTLTLSHGREDTLRMSLDAVRDSWRAVSQSRSVRRAWKRHGVKFVRAVEVTWGQRNGWHPHLHLLLFTDRSLSADELAALGAVMDAAWTAAARARGRNVSEAYGTMLRPVTLTAGAEALAAYLTKVQDRFGDSRDIGREMTRGDLKRVRSRGGLTPFDLAEHAVAGDRQAAALWLEYVVTIKGAKCLSWSNGLRSSLGLGAEVADEDLPADEVAVQDLVAQLDDQQWSLIVRHRSRARLLTLVERRGPDAVDWLLDVLVRKETWERERSRQ